MRSLILLQLQHIVRVMGRWSQGLLTPFDRLEGFERRVHQPEANGGASAPGIVIFHVLSHAAALQAADWMAFAPASNIDLKTQSLGHSQVHTPIIHIYF